jgi:hypothetical protein
MENDLPDRGPQETWLNQPVETRTMTLKLIQQRASSLRAKTRRELLGALIAPLFIGIFFFSLGMKLFPSLRSVLMPLFAFALAWSVAGLYFLSRGLWAAEMPDEGISNGLDFCLREIERQRDLQRRALLWSFGPVAFMIGTFVLGLVLALGGIILFRNGLPFLTLLVIWIVAIFVMRFRIQQKLQRESDELKEIQRENRGL